MPQLTRLAAPPPAGVVLIDEHLLRSPRAMWELGVMMAAVRSEEQPQAHLHTPRPATRSVLPVVLMDLDAVTTAYEQHWTPEAVERARDEGFPPATLADLQCLLDRQGIRHVWVRWAGDPCSSWCSSRPGRLLSTWCLRACCFSRSPRRNAAARS